MQYIYNIVIIVLKITANEMHYHGLFRPICTENYTLYDMR